MLAFSVYLVSKVMNWFSFILGDEFVYKKYLSGLMDLNIRWISIYWDSAPCWGSSCPKLGRWEPLRRATLSLWHSPRSRWRSGYSTLTVPPPSQAWRQHRLQEGLDPWNRGCGPWVPSWLGWSLSRSLVDRVWKYRWTRICVHNYIYTHTTYVYF